MNSTRRQFLQRIGFGTAGLALVSFLPGCVSTPTKVAQPGLARSTPEAQGVSSAGISAFLDALAKSNHEFHSFMMLRHGNVIAEGWWTPYGPQYNHTMYSMSKSFTSTAVGFAVSEGRLSVNDPVISFFPNELPEKPSEHLKNLKVKDLLSMSVGSEKDTTGPITATQNWVKTFLALPIVNAPGTKFLYNSGATYMCSAIVQQLTGQRVIDYLRPRLFEPLDISGVTWETCPRGIDTGGWGLSIKTEGLARFGQMYLQKGKWQGQQIIPAKWVEEATTFKIQQPAPNPPPAKGNERNDWLQGYCYQFWRCQNNGYRGDGAFGQFTIVLPEKDVVIAITSESPNMQSELDLVWQHLLPAIKDNPLPANLPALGQLRTTLGDLALAPVKGKAASAISRRVAGRTIRLEKNALNIDSATLRFENGAWTFAARSGGRQHDVECGVNEWKHGETALPGTPPRLLAGGSPSKGTPFKVAASGAWADDKTFNMMWRYNETPHHDAVQCLFEGDKVQISFQNSITKLRSAKDARAPLMGKLG
jgi:CubicO group peptidase (beta-lactamase class C family)